MLYNKYTVRYFKNITCCYNSGYYNSYYSFLKIDQNLLYRWVKE